MDDFKSAAKEAGLRYVTDEKRGFKRVRRGTGFSYLDIHDEKITDEEVLKRIKSLVIPPAWKNVWICPFKNGHIQATGVDARGRKQYKYHPKWSEVRNETKFEKMLSFGEALPLIRERIHHDLLKHNLPKEKVVAAVVRLLEMTLIRVGNEEYAKENKSFGLTTMRDKHVEISGEKITFEFKGKSGIKHAISLKDRRLARIIKQCQDLPGQELFQYLDKDGIRHTISSDDVNEYLQEITQEEFTAKDFRTWAGTICAISALKEIGDSETKTELKKNLTRAVKKVSQRLGNTPTVCRKYYIHPAVLKAYDEGELLTIFPQKTTDDSRPHDGLHDEEVAVLKFLKNAV
jgi:DNA topoisomerase-1